MQIQVARGTMDQHLASTDVTALADGRTVWPCCRSSTGVGQSPARPLVSSLVESGSVADRRNDNGSYGGTNGAF